MSNCKETPREGDQQKDDVRWRTSSCLCDHVSPELLVTEEGYHDRRPAVEESDRGRSCASVVADGGDLCEQPVVRDVAEDEHVLRHLLASESSPSSRDQGAHARRLDGLKDGLCHRLGVRHWYRPEADVDRWFARVEEGGQVSLGLVAGREVEEIEARDV